MRFPAGALLLVLLTATNVAAAVQVRVEEHPSGSLAKYTVSWELPPGFDESELLIAVENGPRVRLTKEIRERNPRVSIVLPSLSGAARFVVRAGRHASATDSGLAERDIATSDVFWLRDLVHGPVPVRAAATRQEPGHEMEWWADPAGQPMEAPASGFAGSAGVESSGDGPPPVALTSSRDEVRGPVAERQREPGSRSLRDFSSAAPPDRALAFPGALVPLRN